MPVALLTMALRTMALLTMALLTMDILTRRLPRAQVQHCRDPPPVSDIVVKSQLVTKKVVRSKLVTYLAHSPTNLPPAAVGRWA